MDLEKFKQRLQSVVKINKKDTKTLDMINTMIVNQYPPTILFITNLYVLPKNLRFEKDRIFNPRGKTDVSLGKYPSYQNDLNILYQKIITQNKKINNFREDQAPDLIIKYEENKLHKLVYGFLINNKMNNILPEPLFRPGSEKILDSVMSKLVGNKSGKEGIFRKHLLGKRVDFSGRGVIIPDPDLKLDEAGLPYKAGKILFRDQLINRVLKLKEFSETKHDTQTGFRKIPFEFRLRRAEAFLSDPDQQGIVKSWMDELSNKYYILLNRAPSLHRLSIMAFYPKFYEDEDVIRLNPYVCAPFNADFDGDTMAVHVPMLPLSIKDAAEMLPSKILRSAGHGQLVINNKADQALAYYLLTQSEKELDNFKKINGDDFSDLKASMNADKLYSLFDNWQKEPGENYKDKIHKLTPIFRKILNKSGLSLGVDDFILDPEIRQKIKEFEVQFQQEKLSYEKSEDRVNYWNKKSEDIKKQVVKILKELPKDTSPVQILLDSGSGVSEKDLAQLSGMRGIMNRPGGKCLDYPVCSNIVDGMTPLDYFISCHGSRHGLADKGLMTGPAGDLTNIIMQAVQADYIVEDDCGTEQGLYFSAFADLDGRLITLEKRITGRYLAENLLIEHENIAIGTLVDEKIASKIHNSNIKEIKLFSPVTCESVNGVCKKCYGLDLATGLKPPEGFPAGVIAAQSIGEPGTQLTLRTFHTGGTATNQEISQGLTVARKAFSLGIIEEHVKSFINGTAKIIETNNKMRWLEIKGTDLKGDKKTQKIPVFWFDPVSNGFEVKIDQRIFHTIKFCDKQYISIHEVCATFGPITTAEYLLHVFQRIYSKNSAVADHHFEIVLKKILYPLNAGVSSDNEQESSVLKSVLKVGQNTPGFLSRLAFRNISGNLTWAAFRKETDKLQGLKEKLIAGKIRN